MWACAIDIGFAIGRSAYDQPAYHLSVIIERNKLSFRELHPGQNVVRCLEVMELNASYSLGDCAISAILITK